MLVAADLILAFTVFVVAFNFDARSVFDLMMLLMFLSPMLSILWLEFSLALLFLLLPLLCCRSSFVCGYRYVIAIAVIVSTVAAVCVAASLSRCFICLLVLL